jgi:hypothetical protein
MEPVRKLFGVSLFREWEMAQGIYFALDSNGNGRIHNKTVFLAHVVPDPKHETGFFMFSIFGQPLVRSPLRQRGFLSQTEANAAMIAKTETLLEDARSRS